jgi:hypothetical protein
MKTLLWLDDIRNPFENVENKVPKTESGKSYEIHWVKNYDQFIDWITKFGLPTTISFDHDLSFEHYTMESGPYEEKTGLDCAKWVVNYCMDNGKILPKFYVHSANPVGYANIMSLLHNFKKYQSNENF